MRRFAVLLVCLALAASACSENRARRVILACDNAGGSALLAAQTIPGVEFVPCVNDLQAGWTYQHLEARRGEAVFWLDSDRVGDRFLTVTLTPTCDVGSAAGARTDEPGTQLLIDVIADEVTLPISIVPEGIDDPTTAQYASTVADGVRGRMLRDRLVLVTVDAGNDSTEDRIDAALARGEPVLVVGAREREERAVELHLIEGGVVATSRTNLANALDEIEETLDAPRYQAKWYYRFRAGCITYEFDAQGTGIDSIDDEVAASLGMVPVDVFREWARSGGYVIP